MKKRKRARRHPDESGSAGIDPKRAKRLTGPGYATIRKALAPMAGIKQMAEADAPVRAAALAERNLQAIEDALGPVAQTRWFNSLGADRPSLDIVVSGVLATGQLCRDFEAALTAIRPPLGYMERVLEAAWRIEAEAERLRRAREEVMPAGRMSVAQTIDLLMRMQAALTDEQAANKELKRKVASLQSMLRSSRKIARRRHEKLETLLKPKKRERVL